MTSGSGSRQGRSWRLLLGAAVLFVLVLLVTAGAKGYRDLETVRAREAELEERIAAREKRISRLRHRLVLLENDPATLERLAREQLGMVRPGELVFVLPTPEP